MILWQDRSLLPAHVGPRWTLLVRRGALEADKLDELQSRIR